MPLSNNDADRTVVPRWRDFASTVERRELGPVAQNPPREIESEFDFEEKLIAWKTHKSLSFATDAVSSAILFGREEEVFDAAELILAQPEEQFLLAKRVARHALGISGDKGNKSGELESLAVEALHEAIRSIKSDLYLDPRNSFKWVDIARLYETLGLKRRAVRAVEMALKLAPANRFVLRSASRLFLHQDDLDRAHGLLSRSATINHDPWVLAAEIAIASIRGKSSPNIKRGQHLLDSVIPPFHLSELAAALAKLEFAAGSFKYCRKLIRFSLKDPSENAVAQAAWLQRRLGFVEEAAELVGGPSSHEARAWKMSLNCSWGKAAGEAQSWLAEEPFSSRPAVVGSFLYSCPLQDYGSALRLARLGLRANPGNFTLLNNSAFATANLGQLNNARGYYDRIQSDSLSTEDRITWLATGGLIEYRAGNVKEGRNLYALAVQQASEKGKRKLAALASVYQLLEEVNAGVPEAEKIRQDIILKLKGKNIKEQSFLPVIHRLHTFTPAKQLIAPLELKLGFAPRLRSVDIAIKEAEGE